MINENLQCSTNGRNELELIYLTATVIYRNKNISFYLCVLSRSKQVTPKGVWVIDVLVSCWLTSRLHTLEEGMGYIVKGQSQPHCTYSISPSLSLWVSPPTYYAPCKLSGLKAARFSTKAMTPCMSTCLWFWVWWGKFKGHLVLNLTFPRYLYCVLIIYVFILCTRSQISAPICRLSDHGTLLVLFFSHVERKLTRTQ